ncbi:glycerophosphodiester phosphodiesterase family protein [Pedobacter aquatilis]|uniref:glycerophosphodiester phosphodiesterase family protein n=1 Tax=Pedobacter aquatilis TaxID=351343 RepID=UPI0025B5E761|nr:glycerophosphodiester phosphodiesterase family protein [Pedobacter aquatilis]MDN3586341.1 glycerophosphodiester phosphodiesterase family protein [Pedobacter aquatilis]
MKFNSGFFYAFIFLLPFNLKAQQNINVLKIDNAKQLQAFFKYTGKNIPIISGHRGGTVKGFPENSIEAFEHTLSYTPAFFEVDPRLTKDSVVVLMHDATLNRTTNGTGKVADYTYAELQKLRLKDIDGNVTDFKIPTLKEAIDWSKGKTILNLDKKDVPFALQQKIMAEHPNKVIMITVHDAKHAKFYFDKNPETMFSAFVKTKAAFDEYEAAGIPWKNMIAYIGSVNKPENAELFKMLHSKGVMCMISAAPSFDKLADKKDRAEQYRTTFLQGADVLESDLPVEVGEAIQSILPKVNTKKNFFSTLKL